MHTTQPETPPAPQPSGGTLDRALSLVEFLRAHCPWDAAQTPVTLQQYLLEEAHEVVDAIAAGDEAELQGELGDLLLNLAFQVVLAEERGAFGREDVTAGLEQKMRRRHPHLYGMGEPEPWDVLKARERPADAPAAPLLAGLASGMDPLLRAFRIQQRVAEVGFDWDDARGAWEKVREEVGEVGAELEGGNREELEEELGDMLFAMVNLVRLAGTDPTAALSRANAKFTRRFNALERMAPERGVVLGDAPLAELDTLWDEVKAAERAGKARADGAERS
ncbi:MAG TPA: nucleoside triphosphate pyrophosphohydrolase [Longimicrobiaceae bacterium]|nr:nucleoside triphosphate pyrophosphohydrolase [Longimicrobiaceae bacterium]